MKKKTIFITLATSAALILAASVTAFAYSHITTPEILANVTGRTTDEIIAQRNDTGKTYGEIANDAGKLEEFKQGRIDAGKTALDEDVANGNITQDEADKYLADLETRVAACDGTGANCANVGNCVGGHSMGNHRGGANYSGTNDGTGYGGGHHGGRGGRHC